MKNLYFLFGFWLLPFLCFVKALPSPLRSYSEPECKVIESLGISSGRVPDSAINAASELMNYEARNIRLNSATGWCGQQLFILTNYVSVDLGRIYRVKAILVKGVVTNDIVGRPVSLIAFLFFAFNKLI